MAISLIFLLILIVVLNAQNVPQSDIRLSDWSELFQPANSIELLETRSVASFLQCAFACNLNVQCRTFDYDSSSLICRLFEGALETGHIIPATSTSRTGSLEYCPIFFTAFQQPCSQCTYDRYLICWNNTCQCPLHSFWNGSQCENQRYENASCLSDQWCRNDPFGLICSMSNICITSTFTSSASSTSNYNASTITTTSTTTTTTITTTNPCGTPVFIGNTSGIYSTSTVGSSYTCKYFKWVSSVTGMVTLAFQLRNDPALWYIDDVSVSNGTTEMLVNGGFESGSLLPGWTTSTPDGTCEQYSTPPQTINSSCNTGNYCLIAGCYGHIDQVSQSFMVTVGQAYFIRFWLKNSGTGSGISVSVTLS